MRALLLAKYFLVIVGLRGVVVTSSPILDFLDPFLNIGPTGEKKGDPGFGGDVRGDAQFGGGDLAASGHVDAGLGNDLGFNADGSLAASLDHPGIDIDLEKGIHSGEPFFDDKGHQFMDNGPQFQDNKFIHQPQFQDPHLIPSPKGRPILRPRPQAPHRIIPQRQQEVKQPCAHPSLPHPLTPVHKFPPPPPNQKDGSGPFFRKQFRDLNKVKDFNQTVSIKENNATQKNANADPLTPKETGDQFNSKAALRLARNLLDKAILKKGNKTVAEIKENNSVDKGTPTSGAKSRRAISPVGDLDEDFVAVDADKDGDIDEDDEDFLKHARSLLDNEIQRDPSTTKVNPNQVKVNVNATTTEKNATSNPSINKRSTPVLVLEDVKFVPLYPENASSPGVRNATSPPVEGHVDQVKVARSLSPNVTSSSPNATEVDVKVKDAAATANTTTPEESRPISPKMSGISHMFHNIF